LKSPRKDMLQQIAFVSGALQTSGHSTYLKIKSELSCFAEAGQNWPMGKIFKMK